MLKLVKHCIIIIIILIIIIVMIIIYNHHEDKASPHHQNNHRVLFPRVLEPHCWTQQLKLDREQRWSDFVFLPPPYINNLDDCNLKYCPDCCYRHRQDNWRKNKKLEKCELNNWSSIESSGGQLLDFVFLPPPFINNLDNYNLKYCPDCWYRHRQDNWRKQ